MAIQDLSVFDEELGDCYNFSRQTLVQAHFNNDGNVEDKQIFDKVMDNVNNRFLQSVYISFKNFENIYYFECSNKEIPEVEYPGVLVLPSKDGLHRFELELVNSVSIVLSDSSNNKFEFKVDSPGLYRVEDGQVIKSESVDILEEIMQFKFEMSRIFLSPIIFPTEKHHTCEEILEELIKRRKSGEKKVYLTNLVKQIEKTENINDEHNGLGAVINDSNIPEKNTNLTNSSINESSTVTTTYTTSNEDHAIELGENTEEGFTTKEQIRTSVTETITTKITTSTYSEVTEQNITSSTTNAISGEIEGENSGQIEDNKCTDSADLNQIIDEESDNKIHLYTTYTHIHIWDCGTTTTWPGNATVPIEGDKWRELTIDAPSCYIIGNFDGSNGTPEIKIGTPGKYYLEEGNLKLNP